MVYSEGLGGGLSPDRGGKGTSFLKLPRGGKVDPFDLHLNLGQAPTHPSEAMISIKMLQQTAAALRDGEP
jgi:hypothetical protein